MVDKKINNSHGNREGSDVAIPTNESAAERDYTRALRRTALFFGFYEVRKQPIPSEFPAQLAAVQKLEDPERTRRLEALNDRIFAHMIQFLCDAIRSDQSTDREAGDSTHIETAQEVLTWLAKKNPYFALWVNYKRLAGDGNPAEDWEQYVRREIQSPSGFEEEFTLLMAKMGELLVWFRDQNLPVPARFFERAWFLHNLHGAERNWQTRALIHELMEAAHPCGSA